MPALLILETDHHLQLASATVGKALSQDVLRISISTIIIHLLNKLKSSVDYIIPSKSQIQVEAKNKET